MSFVGKGTKLEHLCQVKYCRNDRVTGRRVCYAHHLYSWRVNFPEKAAYQILKDHAKRRKIEFTLTLAEFTKLAEETGYLESKGTTKEDLHIDRIDPLKGYTKSNVRVITCSENAKKGATYDKQQYAEAKRSTPRKNSLGIIEDDEEEYEEYEEYEEVAYEHEITENCPF